MYGVFANIALAFVEGFALIISPCILPILPIILTGSLASGKARPVGIIIGFILTFTLVTLFLRTVITYTHINPDYIRYLSYFLLFCIGVIMLSSPLSNHFNRFTQRFANVGNNIQIANNPQGGLISGMLFGGLVGIVWTPCAGPILAAVIVQSILQKTTLESFFIVLAFGIGAGLPMLLIALLGRRIMTRFNFFREYSEQFRKILGFIIITSVIFLIYTTGSSFSLTSEDGTVIHSASVINKLEHPYPAPAFENISAWINSQPLTMADLKGKVVLIDFWTYSCINCIRTLPYLKTWYAKYHKEGFEIIGVHSPEFAFEHDLNNVKNAVTKFGIEYPVALDNQFSTWQNFHNEYWPAHYLINKEGEVVYEHFGEGKYEVTENNIRYLLGLTDKAEAKTTRDTYSPTQTPEIYLGFYRSKNFANNVIIAREAVMTYHYPPELAVNQWALQGDWLVAGDKITAKSAGAALRLHFSAAKVYAVMGATIPVSVQLTLNGEPLRDDKGSDVMNSQVKVEGNQLYSLVAASKEKEGEIELTALTPGLEIYTFTFGG